MRMKPNQWNPKHLTQIQSIFPKNGEGFWFHYWFWWPGEMRCNEKQRRETTTVTTRNNENNLKKSKKWSKELHKYSQGRPVGAKWKKSCTNKK
jgi:hypothetical protein